MSRDRSRCAVWVIVGALTLLAGVACASQVGTSTAGGSTGSSVTTASGSPGTTAQAPGKGAPRPSAGCGTSTVRALDNDRRTFEVAGVERFYLLTTPTAHDGATPLPLVLDFHGLAEGAQVHTAMSGMGQVAKSKGFVVAFPNGTGTPVRWDANTTSNPNHDVEYVDAIIDRLGRELCIDTSRVYATGLSYGAIMSSFLTCVRADRFAAVAPVAGITMPEGCHPSRPMPAIAFHGTADPILSFNGGLGASLGGVLGGGSADAAAGPTTTTAADLDGAGYPAAVKAWAARNGCKPDATDTKVTEQVIHRVYDCPSTAGVEFYIVLGGGHAWPGSEFSKSIANVVGPTTFDINASELIWEFFTRYQLPA